MLAVTDRISFGLACNIPAFPAGLSCAGRGSSEPSWSSVSRALRVPAASSHSTLSTPPASAEPHNIQGGCRAPGQWPPRACCCPVLAVQLAGQQVTLPYRDQPSTPSPDPHLLQPCTDQPHPTLTPLRVVQASHNPSSLKPKQGTMLVCRVASRTTIWECPTKERA